MKDSHLREIYIKLVSDEKQVMTDKDFWHYHQDFKQKEHEILQLIQISEFKNNEDILKQIFSLINYHKKNLFYDALNNQIQIQVEFKDNLKLNFEDTNETLAKYERETFENAPDFEKNMKLDDINKLTYKQMYINLC